ncbi:hypothetical protein HMPREF9057_00556 [Actinomyces sp. oral taxon 171 str. F0337]|nr:hypothetical protein HMPREF9057_00556 [Actinomyces sp. oral taxon 171 str. F0337]
MADLLHGGFHNHRGPGGALGPLMSWAVGVLRLRTVRLPAPTPAEPVYS